MEPCQAGYCPLWCARPYFWCEADEGASLLPPVPLIVSCRQIPTQHISERAVRRTSRVRFISLGPGKASAEKHRRQAVLVDNAGGNAEDEAHQVLLIECQIPAVHE